MVVECQGTFGARLSVRQRALCIPPSRIQTSWATKVGRELPAPHAHGPALGYTSRLRVPPICATNGKPGGSGGSPRDDDDDDELDRMLGIGRYRGANGRLGSGSQSNASSSSSEGNNDANSGDSSEVQDTLADLLQMEVRRVRAREELASDLEERKAQMRAIGDELQAALDRDRELDRLRTEMGANYVMSETFQALDEVEAEVERIKQQMQADKAELAAWEAQSAEDRSKGLFFKSLYTPPGKQDTPASSSASPSSSPSSASLGASGKAASSSSSSPTASSSSNAALDSGSDSGTEAEAQAERRSKPLSAASPGVRSPLKLYVFSYASAFLALLLVNDLAGVTTSEGSGSGPQIVYDILYGILSVGLGLMAVRERQVMGDAQAAMLEGIQRTAGGARRRRDKGDRRQQR